MPRIAGEYRENETRVTNTWQNGAIRSGFWGVEYAFAMTYLIGQDRGVAEPLHLLTLLREYLAFASSPMRCDHDQKRPAIKTGGSDHGHRFAHDHGISRPRPRCQRPHSHRFARPASDHTTGARRDSRRAATVVPGSGQENRVDGSPFLSRDG